MSKILIVEDEDIIRTALKRLLERNDFQVSEAASVDEALENFKLKSFNLIISDLRLPKTPGTDLIKLAEGIEGREVAEALKEQVMAVLTRQLDAELI